MKSRIFFVTVVLALGCDDSSTTDDSILSPTGAPVRMAIDADAEVAGDESLVEESIVETDSAASLDATETGDTPDTSEPSDPLDTSLPAGDTATEGQDTAVEEEEETDAGVEEEADVDPESGEDTEPPAEPENGDFTPEESGSFVFNSDVVEWQVTPLSTGPIDINTYVPEGEGPFPLLVFAPGFQLAAQNFNWVGQMMASHGYVVLIPTFGDSIFAAIDHADLAMALRSMVDMAVAIDSPLGVAVDSDTIALAGHSRGGKVAILASIQDSRIGAVFAMDPVDTAGGPGAQPSPANPSVTPELMVSLSAPIGIVGAGLGATGFVPCAPPAENYAAYYAETSSPSYQWVLPEAGHNDFAEGLSIFLATACQGGGEQAAVQGFSGTTMIAFLHKHLLGQGGADPWLTGEKIPGSVEVSFK